MCCLAEVFSAFHSAFGGYIGGLAATIVVMNIFEAAQRSVALHCTCCLGGCGTACLRQGAIQAGGFTCMLQGNLHLRATRTGMRVRVQVLRCCSIGEYKRILEGVSASGKIHTSRDPNVQWPMYCQQSSSNKM